MLDVNQTRHHLLLGKADWEPLTGGAIGLEWDAARECLGLEKGVFKFPARPDDRLAPEVRRGAAVDRYGTFYWISDGQTEIRQRPAQARSASTFWPATDPASTTGDETRGDFKPVEPEPAPGACRFCGLAVTTDHFLVVGVLEPERGLLVFDLHGGGPPERYLWPVPFRPFVLSARPEGGVLIVDWDPEGLESPSATPRLWKLTRWLHVEGRIPALPVTRTGGFQPQAPPSESHAEGEHPAPWLDPGDALDITGVLEPVGAFEVASDRLMVIAARTGIHVFDAAGQPIASPVDLTPLVNAAFAEGEEQAPFVTHAAAYVPETSTLWVVGPDGNQAFAIRVGFGAMTAVSAELERRFLPLRRFSGRALVSHQGAVFYDFGERWLEIVEQPRPQFEREGTLVAGPFDARKPGTVWHRAVLDACIPQGTSIAIESQCAEELDQLEAEPWQPLPSPYLRATGSELPFQPALAGEDERSGTWESLFQQSSGRFLRVRLTLTGSGRRTPRIHALRLYYPRFSYAKAYLPAVYQRDVHSASFLDRFLANVEGTFTAIEGRIAHAEQLFDLEACPAEYLEWLAGWIGVVFGDDWEEARRRLFLRHALELFWQRGTRRGLLRMIRLATDACVSEALFTADLDDASSPYNRFGVRIVEAFETGDATPHRFTVSVPITPGQDAEAQQRLIDQIRNVADSERPAHTEFEVQPYWALFRVGFARVGLETQVGIGSRFAALILGAGRLARGYLGTAYPYHLTNRRVVGAIRTGRQPGPGGTCPTCRSS